MRASLNIPQEILESFDATWQDEGLESRSRAVREAIQEYIERHTDLEKLDGPAVAALAFDYEHTLVIGELHTIQHEFEDIIGATQHMHQGSGVLKRSSVRARQHEFENSCTVSEISMLSDAST